MRSRGFSVIEVVVTLGIAGMLTLIAVVNLRSFLDPTISGAEQLMGFMKQARARALTSVSAYTVRPASPSSLITTSGTSCSSATQTPDPRLTLTLPSGVTLTDTAWAICYTSRGLSDSSRDIQVRDSNGTKTVQVVLGGSVRVL